MGEFRLGQSRRESCLLPCGGDDHEGPDEDQAGAYKSRGEGAFEGALMHDGHEVAEASDEEAESHRCDAGPEPCEHRSLCREEDSWVGLRVHQNAPQIEAGRERSS